MEVVFVVVRSMSLQKGITYARKADKYAAWRHEVAKDNYTWLNSNEYTSREGARLKLPKILFNQLRGPGCFDYEHYLARNPDLAVSGGALVVVNCWWWGSGAGRLAGGAGQDSPPGVEWKRSHVHHLPHYLYHLCTKVCAPDTALPGGHLITSHRTT
jgi:hypothetical protein